jgi:hypothetical protein
VAAAAAFPVSTDPTWIEHLLPRGVDPVHAHEGGPYPRIPRSDLLEGAPDLHVHVVHRRRPPLVPRVNAGCQARRLPAAATGP